jgi:gamma-glutamylcyclotransferase (GGCT)/AIG2-like uncharacterized protein YtfP
MTTCPLLFVYGTLRQQSPHPMARYLSEHARFLGLARVAGRLYDLGPYPGLLPPLSADDWVHGDLFQLDDVASTLAALDRYEGDATPLPCLFQREQATVTLTDGETATAWVYWYRGDVADDRRIPSGDYQQRDGHV